MPDDRFVDAIYCDDIRHEIGNKLTLVGCYGSDLVVSALPIALPKLCVLIKVFTPKNRPFGSVAMRVYVGDSLAAELEVPNGGMDEPPGDDSDTRWIVVLGALSLAPFFAERACKVRVEVETESGTMIGPQLRIFAADPTVAMQAAKVAALRRSVPRATKKK